jgi:hypothetical protein
VKFRRRFLVFLAILAAIAVMVVTASAQRAGFQAAGIAPPAPHPMPVGPTIAPFGPVGPVAPFTTAPVAPFVTAPVAPFGVATGVPFGVMPGARPFETFRGVAPPVFFPPVQAPAVVTAPGFHHRNGFGYRSGNTVIVNVGPAIPPVGFFPQENIGLPPVAPIPPVLPTTVAPLPTTVLPVPTTVPPIPSTIPVGATRAQVISQFGPPSVTVITGTGETLYFSGGATVVLQNGQVITGSR